MLQVSSVLPSVLRMAGSSLERTSYAIVLLQRNPFDGLYSKKWITNGTFADYFVVGCRTEKGGLVVLFIERQEGVETKLIKTSYSTAAGTAFVTFDNVFVPYEHTIGPENDGLRVILSNFNHERWGMAVSCIGGQRVIVEECMK